MFKNYDIPLDELMFETKQVMDMPVMSKFNKKLLDLIDKLSIKIKDIFPPYIYVVEPWETDFLIYEGRDRRKRDNRKARINKSLKIMRSMVDKAMLPRTKRIELLSNSFLIGENDAVPLHTGRHYDNYKYHRSLPYFDSFN